MPPKLLGVMGPALVPLPDRALVRQQGQGFGPHCFCQNPPL